MQKTLGGFLGDSTFLIPRYQRDYSWGHSQVDDLLGDIEEAVKDQTSHYLGTFVLSRASDRGPYEIVDGQQRLTTLMLIISALLEQLQDTSPRRVGHYTYGLLRDSTEEGEPLKLTFGINDEFATSLLAGSGQATDLVTDTRGRRRLAAAYGQARLRAEQVRKDGEDQVIRWVETIKGMEVIQFDADTTGRAMRMFQTINDRGLSLSAMDKAKALLVYYSHKYLGGKLDADVSDRFGQCYAAFDGAKELVRARPWNISNISRDGFSEDELLRYHYLAYSFPGIKGGGDYRGSIPTILNSFLKATLTKHVEDKEKLRSFIDDYTKDIAAFAGAFRDLVERITTCERLYKLFVVLGVSARLYPLLVRLQQRELLFWQGDDGRPDLLECVETCDVRVYKTRRRAPAADIGWLSYRSRKLDAKDIGNELGWFTAKFMPDWLFSKKLKQTVFDNRALPFLMLVRDEYCLEEGGEGQHSLEALTELVDAGITREHILPSSPDFDVTELGFDSDQDYREHVDRLGNATALTDVENSRCGARPLSEKVTNSKCYPASRYVSTRRFAVEYRHGNFGKDALVARTEELASWVMKRWRLWG